jgi:hypothetical protein
MSTSTIEALASAWARIAEEAEFPLTEGTATPQAHRASEFRSRFGSASSPQRHAAVQPLHLLGQARARSAAGGLRADDARG